MTASSLTIKNPNGGAVESPANTDGTQFYIYLTDKDKIGYKGGDINVLVTNNRKQDTIRVKMTEDPANPGYFNSPLITAIAGTPGSKTNQISFYAGDTIQVIYIDPDDEEDVSRQTFFSESKVPQVQAVFAEDTDCDYIADRVTMQFSSAINENYSLDSINVQITGMAAAVTLPIKASEAQGKTTVSVNLPSNLGITATPTPRGDAIVYIEDEKTVNSIPIKITDGILPELISVTFLENKNHESELDTVMISFSEPVIPFKQWPLAVGGIDQSGIQVISATAMDDGSSYQFVISGNTGGKVAPIKSIVTINPGVSISDNSFNYLDPTAACRVVKIAETPKPVPVRLAEMRDFEGDGYPDELYMLFERKLRPKDMLDSFVVEWGTKSEVLSFVTPSDTSTGSVVPTSEIWSIEDTTTAPYEIMVDSVPTTRVDTLSIIKIKIPTTQSFEKGATSGPYDGLGRVMPRLGPEGGFFNKNYIVNDKCPPIILEATWKSFEVNNMQMDMVTVKVSEPLETIDMMPYFFERNREGVAGVYYSNQSTPPVAIPTNSYQITFSHDAIESFWLGDSIRLVPVYETSAFRDKAGLVAGGGTPWVPIIGKIDRIKFRIETEQPVTTVARNEFTYGGQILPIEEAFRITLKDKSETVSKVIASGQGQLTPVNGTPMAGYQTAGPVFKIEVTLPDVIAKTDFGEAKRNYEVSLDLDIFNNLGSYVNSASYKFNPMDYRDYISDANSTITLYLEWCVPEDAPVSEKGRKIATGPYIAKFSTKAKGAYVATTPDEGDDPSDFKYSDTFTRTFGFRRK